MTDKRVKVLLIEDNPGDIRLIREFLAEAENIRFDVECADRLSTGLDRLAQGYSDVVLLDLSLPDSQGLETFTKLHTRAPGVPIVVLTVLDDEMVTVEALRRGAQDYLVKGEFDSNLLVRAVHYAIERKRTEESLRQLTVRLLQLQDEERRRMARELHDTTAQSLAALTMNLSLVKESGAGLDADSRRVLADSVALAEQCAQEIRTLSYLLHPPLLEDAGLASAVRWYAEGFAQRSGIRVELEISPEVGRLGREAELTLFRIVQESLVNIRRHSGSPTARIRLLQNSSEVILEVADEGRGMQPATLEKIQRGAALGVGIAGMRERVKQLGGRLEILSGPGGTTVKAILPQGD